MSTTNSIAFFAGIMACGASLASAQDTVTTPIQNWSYQRHSSTATEGYLRGAASVVQATGQKNYLDSIALVNFREAQRRAIENNKLYVQSYLDNKEAIRQYRKRYAAVPPTMEAWAAVVENSMPDRMTPEQYNPDTGRLTWPHILRTDEYAAMRDRIDILLLERTPENSGDGSPSQRELATLIDGMKYILRTNLNTVTSSQYVAARSFLESFDYEMKFPMPDIAAASRATGSVAIN